MSKNDEILKLFAKSEELLEALKGGRQFTEELLQENERLRLRVAQLEIALAQQPHQGGDENRLRVENEQLLHRIERLEQRFSQVEAENRDFALRYVEVERQNEGLANLYVASYQLHSTLDLREVVEIILEIVVNLIGAEEFVLFMVNDDGTELTLMGGELGLRLFPRKIPFGQGVEGEVAVSKKLYRGNGENGPDGPLLCLPLKISVPIRTSNVVVEELLGVISIYKLLGHKKGFTALDYELLNMLAGHAATALLSAKLYHGTERKLRTIEGFINLLRSQ